MPHDTLEQILEVIRRLKPHELRQIERTVQDLLDPTSPAGEREASLSVLQEAGLVKEIKRPPMVRRPHPPPIPIQGKPLSETIIEERR